MLFAFIQKRKEVKDNKIFGIHTLISLTHKNLKIKFTRILSKQIYSKILIITYGLN